MKVIIENSYIKSLKVGDALIDDAGGLFFVVENKDGVSLRYSIKGALQYSGAMLTDNSLERLTADAIGYGYKIYHQDEYDLILRKK